MGLPRLCAAWQSCVQGSRSALFDMLSPDPLAAPTPAPSRSYDDPEIALQCGQMFRDCIRHEAVARLVLDSHIFPAMFGKLELSNFEVASGELHGQGRRHCKLEGRRHCKLEGRRLASPSAAGLCRACSVGAKVLLGTPFSSAAKACLPSHVQTCSPRSRTCSRGTSPWWPTFWRTTTPRCA